MEVVLEWVRGWWWWWNGVDGGGGVSAGGGEGGSVGANSKVRTKTVR